MPTEDTVDLFQRAVEVGMYTPSYNMRRMVGAGWRPRWGRNANTS